MCAVHANSITRVGGGGNVVLVWSFLDEKRQGRRGGKEGRREASELHCRMGGTQQPSVSRTDAVVRYVGPAPRLSLFEMGRKKRRLEHRPYVAAPTLLG